MKIKKFLAKNLHGYLNFDINFNEDLTFLTGINGSGKTSIVKAISSLIFPSIVNLAHIHHDLVQVEIDYYKDNIVISSKRKKDKIILSSQKNDETPDKIEINIFPSSEYAESPRYREEEEDYYSEEIINVSNRPTIKLIEKLPTPLILGIGRRGSEFFQIRKKRMRYLNRSYLQFPESSVNLSIAEAVSLAEEKFIKIQTKLKENTEELKKKLIHKAIEYSVGEKKDEIRKLKSIANEETLKKVISVIVKLGYNEKEIENKLTKFFNKMKEAVEYITDGADLDSIISSKNENLISNYFQYTLNKSQFFRMMDVVDYIEEYSKVYEKINEPISKYTETVNHFIKDSNKELLFDKNGSLIVIAKNRKYCTPKSLSSGEMQIIIIMTHLAFNESIQKANIFIIDEPELSLHIRWQEIFVETIRKLNPALQLIIATHSPSILLDDTEHCISLNKGVEND